MVASCATQRHSASSRFGFCGAGRQGGKCRLATETKAHRKDFAVQRGGERRGDAVEEWLQLHPKALGKGACEEPDRVRHRRVKGVSVGPRRGSHSHAGT